jgi:orotidine-5'-phosphate decarboxylase
MTRGLSRIFVALTSDCGSTALEMLEPLRGLPLGVKIGLELFTREGPGIVRTVKALGFHVFLDLKFHDIPHTVAGAVRSACLLGPDILNVHASGGLAMMRAAAEAVTGDTRLIAVTVLTSLDREDLELLAPGLTPGEASVRLAAAARKAGLHGVVCSPLEAAMIRAEARGEFLIVTPGVRPADSSLNDQKRVATPSGAVLAGADSLVVGRPITGAPDPRAAAEAILREVESALEG